MSVCVCVCVCVWLKTYCQPTMFDMYHSYSLQDTMDTMVSWRISLKF